MLDLDKPLSESELQVLWVMEGRGTRPGGFYESLIQAMGHADFGNLSKLKIIFPELVSAFIEYSMSNLHERADFQKIERIKE